VPYRAYMAKRGKTVFGDPPPTKTCPYCKSSDLPVEATACSHCTRELAEAASCQPGSAAQRPMARGPRTVQRSVQARVSPQYQRRSAQAWPPSAIIWLVGKRMPHIQQDSNAAPSAPCRPAPGGAGRRRGPSGTRLVIGSSTSDIAGFDEAPTVMSPPEGWSARGRRGPSMPSPGQA